MRFCQMILNGGSYSGAQVLTPESVKAMTSNQIGDKIFGELADGTKFRFGYGFAIFSDQTGLRGERSWGGIWGTVFRVSLHGNWAAVLLTQRVYDESAREREVEFTRIVRRAIMGQEVAASRQN